MAKFRDSREIETKCPAQLRNPECVRYWFAVVAIVVTILYGLGLVFAG